MMHALDLPTITATALVAIERPDATWNKTMNGHPKSQVTDPREIRKALDGQPANLPAAAWVAFRGDKVWVEELRVSRILGWLAALEVHEDAVLWTARNGFQPRAGALGLLIPAADYTLRWDDGQVRRVVVGARTAFGRGLFVFTNLDVDKWGNPHPVGLYLLSGD